MPYGICPDVPLIDLESKHGHALGGSDWPLTGQTLEMSSTGPPRSTPPSAKT
jgi:hypothetical protein